MTSTSNSIRMADSYLEYACSSEWLRVGTQWMRMPASVSKASVFRRAREQWQQSPIASLRSTTWPRRSSTRRTVISKFVSTCLPAHHLVLLLECSLPFAFVFVFGMFPVRIVFLCLFVAKLMKLMQRRGVGDRKKLSDPLRHIPQITAIIPAKAWRERNRFREPRVAWIHFFEVYYSWDVVHM